MLLVTCTNCGAKLLLSKDRQPVCGKCNQPVSANVMNSAPARPAPGASLLSTLRAIFRKRPREIKLDSPLSKQFLVEGRFAPLQRKVDGLVKRAWPDGSIGTVLINPNSIDHSIPFEAFVSELLKHARHTTELSTPWRTPRVVVEKTSREVGGRFVVDEGWVAIVVGQEFFRDVAAARAILCHEVCHYILNMVDIRDTPQEENERLTDVAMFVFGFGLLFRAGYRRAPTQNRKGHRVGYLSDPEYDFVEKYVASLTQARRG